MHAKESKTFIINNLRKGQHNSIIPKWDSFNEFQKTPTTMKAGVFITLDKPIGGQKSLNPPTFANRY